MISRLLVPASYVKILEDFVPGAYTQGGRMAELRKVEIDIEEIVSRQQMAAWNDRSGKRTVSDYLADGVREALRIAGVEAVAPPPAVAVEGGEVRSAVDLALERATIPASEGVRQ